MSFGIIGSYLCKLYKCLCLGVAFAVFIRDGFKLFKNYLPLSYRDRKNGQEGISIGNTLAGLSNEKEGTIEMQLLVTTIEPEI